MQITAELVKQTWRHVYAPEIVDTLFAQPRTPLEVLTDQSGVWRLFPAKARLQLLVQTEVLTATQLRLLALFCVEYPLWFEWRDNQEPDAWVWDVLKQARAHATDVTRNSVNIWPELPTTITDALLNAAQGAHTAEAMMYRRVYDAVRLHAKLAAHSSINEATESTAAAAVHYVRELLSAAADTPATYTVSGVYWLVCDRQGAIPTGHTAVFHTECSLPLLLPTYTDALLFAAEPRRGLTTHDRRLCIRCVALTDVADV